MTLAGFIVPVAQLIEALGGAYLLWYVLRAFWTLTVRTPGSGTDQRLTAARLLIAEGVLTALNFKVAATLLKTLELHTWPQIGMFAAIFALRTLLKRFFIWERDRLEYIQANLR